MHTAIVITRRRSRDVAKQVAAANAHQGMLPQSMANNWPGHQSPGAYL